EPSLFSEKVKLVRARGGVHGLSFVQVFGKRIHDGGCKAVRYMPQAHDNRRAPGIRESLCYAKYPLTSQIAANPGFTGAQHDKPGAEFKVIDFVSIQRSV